MGAGYDEVFINGVPFGTIDLGNGKGNYMTVLDAEGGEIISHADDIISVQNTEVEVHLLGNGFAFSLDEYSLKKIDKHVKGHGSVCVFEPAEPDTYFPLTQGEGGE